MEREVARLEHAGTAVISLEPGAASRRAMGLRAMAEDRSPRVVEAAYEETRRRILSTTPSLASLGGRRRRPRRLIPESRRTGAVVAGAGRSTRRETPEGRVDEP